MTDNTAAALSREARELGWVEGLGRAIDLVNEMARAEPSFAAHRGVLVEKFLAALRQGPPPKEST